MGNEESGIMDDGGYDGAKGGRRGVGRREGSGSGSNGSGDYAASGSSSYKPSGGRRGEKKTGRSGAKYTKPSGVDTGGGGGDDIFSDMNLPMGETPKSICDKGRSAFANAIFSPRGGSKRSSASKNAPKFTSSSNNRTPAIKEVDEKTPPKESPQKNSPKKTVDFSSFDSLYYGDTKKTKNKSAASRASDDDHFSSDPFGVGVGGGGRSMPDKAKTRSIDVDVKVGRNKLKDRVRADNQKKQQQRQKKRSTFHRPDESVMFDTFDDLEEEMIGDGEIGNGNKSNKRTSSIRQRPKQLSWDTGASTRKLNGYESSRSNGRNRNRGGGGGGGEDGWF